MPSQSELVRRSGDLKAALVEYASRDRFQREFRREVIQDTPEIERDQGQLITYFNVFILEYPLADGETILEKFVADTSDLTDDDRAMLLGWHDSVEGIFRVHRREGDAIELVGVLDELTYRVWSNIGPHTLRSLRPGIFLLTRILPVGQDWVLSGATHLFPTEQRAVIKTMAIQHALADPSAVFRNPAKIDEGWQLQREERRAFIEFFGADSVVVPGRDISARIRDFWDWRSRQAFGDEEVGDPGLSEPFSELRAPSPELDLPDKLTEIETVGLIHDEVAGLCFVPNWDLLKTVFDVPKLASDPKCRRYLQDVLESPSIFPSTVRRLADPDPAKASDVFQRVLKSRFSIRKQSFDWTRDGEDLLRRYKADYYERPRLPHVKPISYELVRLDVEPVGSLAGPVRPAGRKLSRRKKRTGRRR